MAGRHAAWRMVAAALGGCLVVGTAWGASGAEGTVATWSGQVERFLSFRDPAVRYAVFGAVFLGVSCGLLGGFLVVRRLALVGDTLSHAVLPGVAGGFLWGQTKDPVAILVGAVAAGLLGTLVVNWIRRGTRLKEDAALGLVLAGFYAVGICLVTMIQRLSTGNKGGIDQFLFGQAAALGGEDVVLMGAVAAGCVLVVAACYKELLVASFDPDFARAAGFPVRWIHDGLMLLLAFAVVSALQAVGVVLVSAMLVTPAAAAYLLTDRFHRLLGWSVLLGGLAGVSGCFVSFLGSNLPTGPLMVLSASGLFGMAFLFAPKHGLVLRVVRRRRRARRIGRENALKSVYQALEDGGFREEEVPVAELAARRRVVASAVLREARSLERRGLARVTGAGRSLALTPEGLGRARDLVRNHRLWELYLTQAANVPADHVHDEAETIEHVLGEATVGKLLARLKDADRDPHGRPIPGGAPREGVAEGKGARHG